MDSVIINNLNGGYTDTKVLNDVSLCFESNKMNAIIGPNGSGKSTLIKFLIRELKAENNKISIIGKDINEYSQKELAEIQSMVPQISKQEYDFTVYELVSLGRYCHNDIDKNEDTVNNTLSLVGIQGIKDKLITEISGGEMQLAMLARAICQETNIILLDEPTNNLDPAHQLLLMELLTKIKEQNKTIICAIHDLNAVFKYFDNAVLMKDGKIFASGKVNDVLTESNIDAVYNVRSTVIPSDGRLPSTVYYNL